jgi:hypothetical protein
MVPSLSVEISMLFRLLTSYSLSNSITPCVFSEWNGPYFSCKVIASIFVLVSSFYSYFGNEIFK